MELFVSVGVEEHNSWGEVGEDFAEEVAVEGLDVGFGVSEDPGFEGGECRVRIGKNGLVEVAIEEDGRSRRVGFRDVLESARIVVNIDIICKSQHPKLLIFLLIRPKYNNRLIALQKQSLQLLL